MKLKSILICLFIVCGFVLQAQTISVKTFQALPMDMTASSLEGKRIDQNGEAAALIKVVTSETGFYFEGGTLGIVDSKQEHGEIWVWVPRGARKITIKHDQLGILRDYRYPIEIEAERTYEMVLERIVSEPATVTIKPNQGWIEVTGGSNDFGASIYIDDSFAGKVPFKSKAISAGQYKVCIVKDLFDMFCETIAVRENEVSRITPILSTSMSNYSDVSNGDNIDALLSDAKYGIVNGEFSVSPTNKVYFSQGNLQYQASTNSWRFAEKQWDYVGETNQNISDSYSGWIDLFGWGTGESPSKHIANGSYYMNYVEWGNNISNEIGSERRWRTMTKAEWEYLINGRKTESGIRYAKAKLNYINGLVILPDNWNEDAYKLNYTNNAIAAFSSNLISVSDWGMLESLGAVFLPAAGNRRGTAVSYSGVRGWYWTEGVSSLCFDESYLSISVGSSEYGHSVRLVVDCK